jgi:Core-2/I-Branching enzyme
MKLAYIILAHKYPEQLTRLVNRLNTETASFFIHIDQTTDAAIYDQMVQELSAFSNVYWLKRHDTYWGSFRAVKATYEGIQELFNKKIEFDYVSFLTGQDYPIKSVSYIEKYLTKNLGKEFIEYYPLPCEQWRDPHFTINIDRVENWFINGKLVKHNFIAFKDEISLKLRILLSVCSLLMRLHILRRKRKFPEGFQPFGGSAYWCLSRNCAEYINNFIQQNPAFINFFRFAGLTDEVFFQTIILNSPFKEQVINDDLRYVVWPGPANLGKKDLASLLNASELFARKFDSTIDPEILDLIDQQILDLSQTINSQ